MTKLFTELNEIFCGQGVHRHQEVIFIQDVFKVQKYHDKIELYFYNSFFGELTEEQVVSVLKIYKEGQR